MTRSSLFFAALSLGLSLAACTGSSSNVPKSAVAVPIDGAKRQADVERLLASKGFHIAKNARVFQTDTLSVRVGDAVSLFAASSSVTRTSDGITIVDAQTGQTFHFPPTAILQAVPGGGRVYVSPGAAPPAWATASNARPATAR